MKNTPPFRFSSVLFSLALIFVLFASLTGGASAQGLPPPPEDPRIVGGVPADPGEWPWQVALVGGNATNLYNGQFCGGSLVSPQWVVTAAHCVNDIKNNPSQVDIVAGIYNLQNPAPGYQRRDVAQIIVHPQYNPSTSDKDIALLRLFSPVTLGGSGATKTQAIPLVPSSIGALVGIDSWVTGWGNTSGSGQQYPTQLYEVSVPIISNAICNNASHYNGEITANMLCAGFDAGGKDSCQGDSGGPLVIDNGGQWQLAGVVSWGYGCAEPYLPGVYTRVSNFTTWVNSYVQTATPETTIFRSNGSDDGWIRESSETSSTGGALNSIQTVFVLGDSAADQQYRTILSFNTAGLPDTAVITSVTLKIKYMGVAGTNPFNTHGNIIGDIRSGPFNGLRTLENADFAAASGRNGAFVILNKSVGGWYSDSLSASDFIHINLLGLTQIRLRFKTGDNDDLGKDILKFYSGNASPSLRPQLIVKYTVP